MKTGARKRKTVRKRARTINAKTLVNKAIGNIEDKLETDEVKGTVGDLIRLLQLKKELDTKTPKEVQVKWVEEESSNE